MNAFPVNVSSQNVHNDNVTPPTRVLQAMHLVYRAMENETTPTALPASLIPPSKRKKSAGALPGAVAVLPVLTGLMGSPPLKETLRSTPSLGSVAPINTSLSPKHSFKAASQVRPAL